MKLKKLKNFNFFALITSLMVVSMSFTGCKGKEASISDSNPYNLEIITTLEEYLASVQADSINLLVDLEDYIPGIVTDIRYATEDNFTGQIIYTAPKAWFRKDAADSLLKIQNILKEEGLGIKVFDAYRPYAATLYFYEVFPDTMFVAAPWRGSIHNRGGAIDLTLIDLYTGEELEMPTPFDEFSERASHSYANLTPEAIKNREKLLRVMTENGFTMYEHEWWHYNIKGRNRYPLMDISFEDLETIKNRE